jgi:hypothetical protein
MTHKRTSPQLSMPRVLAALVVVLALVGGSTAGAQGYVFPSTNQDNASAGHPHVVRLASSGPGEVILEFVNATNSLAYFEYRIDGQVPGGITSPHPIVLGDVIYPGVCVDSRGAGSFMGCPAGAREVSLLAGQTVEVRLALGGERDWDFDWVAFDAVPSSKKSCKNGGWATWGFENQRACKKFVKNNR